MSFTLPNKQAVMSAVRVSMPPGFSKSPAVLNDPKSLACEIWNKYMDLCSRANPDSIVTMWDRMNELFKEAFVESIESLVCVRVREYVSILAVDALTMVDPEIQSQGHSRLLEHSKDDELHATKATNRCYVCDEFRVSSPGDVCWSCK